MESNSIGKILIIDDDTTQQVLAKEYLGSEGFTVRIAEDGQRGLSLAATTSPDIILLDLLLPSVDGYAICKHLKQNSETTDIPIILITGSRDQEVIRRGLAAGATDFVTKPLDWEFLADRVKHVLRQHEAKSAPVAIVPAATEPCHAAGSPEKDPEVNALRAMLAGADSKIASLEDEIRASKEHAPSQLSESDLSDLQNQLSEIEKEWTVRLQDAVMQANKRADQRYQKLKLSHEENARDNASVVRQLKQQVDVAEREKQALLHHNNDLVEAAARQAECEAALQKQLEHQQTEFAECTESVWSFLETNTNRQRQMFRDTQARIADLRKLVSSAPEAEQLHKGIDQVEAMLSFGTSATRKLRALAAHNCKTTEYEKETIYIKNVIDDLAGTVPASVGRIDVRVHNDVQAELATAGDCEAFAQVFEGLLENALRNSPPNSSVMVRGYTNSDGGLEVCIADHGFGIDSALLKEIEEFLGAHATPVPASDKWSGSGLAMAKQVLHRHGGGLSIQSALGQGTEVIVNIPTGVSCNAPFSKDGIELQEAS